MRQTVGKARAEMLGPAAAATCLACWSRHNAALHVPKPDRFFRPQTHYAEMDRVTRFVCNALPGRRLGQRSADYQAFPDAARRIADVLHDIPLVVQLSNSVDRANFQHWTHYRRRTTLLSGGVKSAVPPHRPPACDAGTRSAGQTAFSDIFMSGK